MDSIVKTEKALVGTEIIFETRFFHITCRLPGRNDNLRGVLVLSKSKLSFVSEQNGRLDISLGSISSIVAKRAFYKPSVDIEWDEGVISQCVSFSQEDNHLTRSESIVSVPKLVELFRWEKSIKSKEEPFSNS